MSLLKVNKLKVHYPIRGGFLRRVVDQVRAVDGISFELEPGETYGLVGESGCGKTTTGRAIIGLNKATDGEMLFEGTDLAKLRGSDRRQYTKDIQMIFQDPYSSLNARKNVLSIISEPLRNFERMSPSEELKRVQTLIERVGLNPESIYKYPHQFSGGQRQRIGIARALTLNPKLIIADEPVSALDVSVQAQVLNFMQEIQKEFNLTYLFISHDLGIIQHMCDRIGIMYKGRFVEEGTAADVYNNPQHLYTKRLIAAIPEMNPEKRFEKTHLRQSINEAYRTDSDSYFDKD
jgi:peptide/nickel transport system ATP-binding protein